MIHRFPSIAENPFKRMYRHNDTDLLSEYNSGSALFYKKHHLDGRVETKYHKNLIDILDRVFRHKGMKFLSREQERFISKFFNQADTINKNYVAGKQNIYEGVYEEFKNLDQFLGSYRSEKHACKHIPKE